MLRAPNHAESHNIEGLVCEARLDYSCAIAAYRRARVALTTASYSDSDVVRSRLADVSVNLARSLCKVNVVITKVSILTGCLCKVQFWLIEMVLVSNIITLV